MIEKANILTCIDDSYIVYTWHGHFDIYVNFFNKKISQDEPLSFEKNNWRNKLKFFSIL